MKQYRYMKILQILNKADIWLRETKYIFSYQSIFIKFFNIFLPFYKKRNILKK